VTPEFDLSRLLAQAQRMQEEMKAANQELATRTYDGSAGGGAVRVTVTGDMRVTAIAIEPEVIDPMAADLLTDLVLVAVNQALGAAAADAGEALGGLAGGLDLGGIFNPD
jgi:DNA-binding YbaB/EbfC family protein